METLSTKLTPTRGQVWATCRSGRAWEKQTALGRESSRWPQCSVWCSAWCSVSIRTPRWTWGGGVRTCQKVGGCPLDVYVSGDSGYPEQEGAQVPTEIIPHPSIWAMPTLPRRARRYHETKVRKAMGWNTPPGHLSPGMCLGCRTDPGKEAIQGLFSTSHLGHGPGWAPAQQRAPETPEYCSPSFPPFLLS